MKKIPTTDREAMAECLVRDEKRIKRMKPSAKRDVATAEFERLSARFLEIYRRPTGMFSITSRPEPNENH